MSFKEEFSKRYPQITLVDGLPESCDVKGSPYSTIMIGGEVSEDRVIPYTVVFNSREAYEDFSGRLWSYWWHDLHEVMMRLCPGRPKRLPTEVHIRKEPEFVSDYEHIMINQQDHSDNFCSRVVICQIRARLSFHYD